MVIDLGILSIKVDVLIFQIINIMLLLWIIRKAFGDTIVDQIAHFRDTRKKMAEADLTLEELIADAEKEKQKIISDGIVTKEKIISEAHVLAQTKEKEILDQANTKAKHIVKQANAKAHEIENEIKDNYTHLVKQSAWSIVKKLFENNPEAQQEYMKTVTQSV